MLKISKTIKYACEYSRAKNKFYNSANIYLDTKNSLSERNNAALDLKKDAKHIVGLARLLGLFSDSNNEKPIQRIAFADKLWEKMDKKYSSGVKVA